MALLSRGTTRDGDTDVGSTLSLDDARLWRDNGFDVVLAWLLVTSLTARLLWCDFDVVLTMHLTSTLSFARLWWCDNGSDVVLTRHLVTSLTTRLW